MQKLRKAEHDLPYAKHILRGGLLFKKLLEEGPQSIEQLAAVVGVSVRTTQRYMAAIEYISEGAVHIRQGYRRDSPRLWAVDADALIQRLQRERP